MPLPPPVTTAVLPANSVKCTPFAFRSRSRYGPSPTSSPVGKRSVRAMSSRQAPPGLARELLEEIDSPCLGTSEISTGGGDGKLGWVSFAPLDDPHHPLRRNCIVCFWAPIVLPSERSQVSPVHPSQTRLP